MFSWGYKSWVYTGIFETKQTAHKQGLPCWEKLPLRLRGFLEKGFTQFNITQPPNNENHFACYGLYLWTQECNPNSCLEIGKFFLEKLDSSQKYFRNKHKLSNIYHWTTKSVRIPEKSLIVK